MANAMALNDLHIQFQIYSTGTLGYQSVIAGSQGNNSPTENISLVSFLISDVFSVVYNINNSKRSSHYLNVKGLRLGRIVLYYFGSE
jgi:hypothetical protein